MAARQTSGRQAYSYNRTTRQAYVYGNVAAQPEYEPRRRKEEPKRRKKVSHQVRIRLSPPEAEPDLPSGHSSKQISPDAPSKYRKMKRRLVSEQPSWLPSRKICLHPTKRRLKPVYLSAANIFHPAMPIQNRLISCFAASILHWKNASG